MIWVVILNSLAAYIKRAEESDRLLQRFVNEVMSYEELTNPMKSVNPIAQ